MPARARVWEQASIGIGKGKGTWLGHP
jgi:hypothetical protein